MFINLIFIDQIPFFNISRSFYAQLYALTKMVETFIHQYISRFLKTKNTFILDMCKFSYGFRIPCRDIYLLKVGYIAMQ